MIKSDTTIQSRRLLRACVRMLSIEYNNLLRPLTSLPIKMTYVIILGFKFILHNWILVVAYIKFESQHVKDNFSD